ncbi:MAG: MTH1187 family thiamine-binding protein [Actinobacteria bacterium]|nr:MTH1187 family thiamine-binding protein [Actinomycetota bacterium]
MVVAEFTVIPIVEGSLRPFVKAAVAEVEKAGLKFEVGAMGTTVEGTLDEVLEVVKSAHRAVLAAGAGRVITSIKIDDRDSGLTIEGKLEGFR